MPSSKKTRSQLSNISFRWVLVVPFVLQILGAVGLVSYFSYRSGQQAVEHLADHLMIEVSDRIDQHLNTYLGNAQAVNQMNLNAVQTGVLDLNNFNALGKYFYQQNRAFDFAYVNFGSKEKGFIGSGYGVNNISEIAEILPSNPNQLLYYAVNSAGDRGKLLGKVKNSTMFQDAWYRDAVKAGKPVWSSVYTWADIPDHISLSASAPVYDPQNKLLGVLGIDLELSQIGRFLQTLNHQNGSIFILERSGLIIASSEKESVAPLINGKAQRLSVLKSQSPIIRNVTESLTQKFGSLDAIKSTNFSKLEDFPPDKLPRLWVKIRPFHNQYGLDWLVVTVIPESHFMEPIHANVKNTVLLCGITVLVTMGIGILTTRWITRPIGQLNRANQAFAQGEFQEVLPENIAIAELQQLAISFNKMSAQIQQSFEQVEGELHDSREMYQRVVQTQTDFILRSQPDTTITFANEALCNALGNPLAQVIGQKWIDFGDPDDLQNTLNQLSALTPANPSFIGENRDQRAEGQIGWTQWINQGIFNEQGKLIEIQSVGRDITNLKQAELETKRVQLFLNSIIENIPNMVFVKEAETLKFISFNKAGEDLLGYSREDLFGKNDNDFFSPEEAQFFIAKDRQVLAQGRVLDIPEEIIHTQNQEKHILHTKKIPIFDESGQPQYLLGISEDITERIESENRLTQLARNIPGMIYQFRMRSDNSSHFPYTSEGIRDIYGVTPQQVKEDASVVFSVLHPDDLERVSQSILESAANLSIWNCEYRIRFADGRIIWVVGHATPRREADGSNIWHGYITDISDRKQAETLLIAAKEKAEEAEIKLQKSQINLERINKRLLKLIDTDTLTKIANRRCFNIRFRQDWKRLYRDQQPLSLILFDVDYFKHYNDHYGHPQGDKCLIQVSQTARKAVKRSMDLVARVGGEEFAVILPNTNLQGAKIVAESIRLAIQSLAILHEGSELSNKKLTISLGIMSAIPNNSKFSAHFYNQADQALLQAKKRGRNQFFVFTEDKA